MIVHKISEAKQNAKCILFFNGWGMDCNAVNHLQSSNYDVFVIYDYRSMQLAEIEEITGEISEIFNSYEEVYLLAWSLGVWVAQSLLAPYFAKFTKTIAINGTPQPVDDNFGIAKHVFAHTLENWNERNRKKFNARMCGGNLQLNEWQEFMSQQLCEEQQQELQVLYNAIADSNTENAQWTKAVIGSNDLIFTAQNQQNYWQQFSNFHIFPFPHFPFANETSWDNILRKFQ